MLYEPEDIRDPIFRAYLAAWSSPLNVAATHVPLRGARAPRLVETYAESTKLPAGRCLIWRIPVVEFFLRMIRIRGSLGRRRRSYPRTACLTRAYFAADDCAGFGEGASPRDKPVGRSAMCRLIRGFPGASRFPAGPLCQGKQEVGGLI